MSGFVRRAQRKVEKLEALLSEARAEVARQIELDVERAAAKVVRDAEKKAQQKAARAANPERIRRETMTVLMKLCVKENLTCDASTVNRYMEWKKTVEFPPNTNLYHKCARFVKEAILDKTEAIPVYAKTLTGELIPLVYHPHHDSRDLLIQLEQISPEEFPIGSTSITRLCDEEDAKTPVKEGDLFGLFQHGAKVVSYSRHTADKVECPYLSQHTLIVYELRINPDGLVRGPQLRLTHSLPITLYFCPESQTISTRWEQAHQPLSELNNLLQSITIYDFKTNYSFSLSDQAREEVIAIFHAIRRDQ